MNRKYLILNVSEIDLIDFSEVFPKTKDGLQYSLDHSKTYIKWDGDITPFFIPSLTTKEGPYNNFEILEIISSNEWYKPTI
jgi:hypothetical protein